MKKPEFLWHVQQSAAPSSRSTSLRPVHSGRLVDRLSPARAGAAGRDVREHHVGLATARSALTRPGARLAAAWNRAGPGARALAGPARDPQHNKHQRRWRMPVAIRVQRRQKEAPF